MPISEQDALAVLKAYPSLPDGDRKQRSFQLLNQYRDQQRAAGLPSFPSIAQKRVDELDRAKRYFTDPVNHGYEPEQMRELREGLKFDPDPAAEQRFFNTRYLSKFYGKPADEILEGYEGIRDAYAQKHLGQSGPVDDGTFFQLMSRDIEQESEILDRARETGLAGLDPLKALSQIQGESELPKKRREQFLKLAGSLREQLQPYRGTIEAISRELRIKTGVEEGLSEVDPWPELAGQLLAIPAVDRDLVIAAIVATGGTEGEGKGFGQKFAESLSRSARNIVKDVPAAQARSSLTIARRLLESDTPVPAGEDPVTFYLSRFVADSGDTTGAGAVANAAALAFDDREFAPPTPEQKAQSLAEIDRDLELIDLDHRVRQIADLEIDPVRGSNIFSQAAYTAAASLPYTGIALMPGGWVINSQALAEESYHRLRAANPDMTREQAQTIAQIAGPLQAATEQISAGILVGRLPVFDRLLKQVVATKGAVFARGAIRLGGGAAMETVQENIQDVTPFAVQEVIGALQQDAPEVPWGDILGDMAAQQGEIFLSSLYLGIIGGGVGTWRDVKGSLELMGNVDALMATGIDADTAHEISTLTNARKLDRAQELLRQEFRDLKLDRTEVAEVRQQAASRLASEAQEKANALFHLEKLGALPAIRHEADGQWSLRFGEDVVRFDEYEEAASALFSWMGDQEINIHESTRAEIEALSSGLDWGRGLEIDFTGRDQRGLDVVLEGEASKEQMLGRDEVGETLQGQEKQAPDLSEEPDPVTEYETAQGTVVALSATQEARLASQKILGSNISDWKQGVYETAIRLNQGATPLTVIEEKLEGDVSAMLLDGRREWLVGSLRSLEGSLGESIFREGIADDQLTDQDIKEAYSHVGMSYVVGKSTKRDALWAGKSFRKTAAQILRGELGGPLSATVHFFRAVWRRAAKLNKLRREGRLDAELEGELARSLGISEEITENRRTLEAAEELRTELDENMAFSAVSGNTDADYLAAVERGDMETAQRMVDEAARAAGYTVGPVYRGDTFQPLVYDRDYSKKNLGYKSAGFFFTPNKEAAAQFGPNVRAFYLNPGSVNKEVDRRGEEWGNDAEIFDAEEAGSTSFLRKNVGYGLFLKDIIGTDKIDEWTVFDPSQMKSADPVTYDASGNPIPLSQRFDATRPEITFSSLTSEDLEAQLARMFDPFQRSPELRRKLGVEMLRRARKTREAWEPILRRNRTNKEIDRIRKETEDRLFNEKFDAIDRGILQPLESAEMASLLDHPMIAQLVTINPEKKGFKWKGRLESRTAYERRTGKKAPAEYDGVPDNMPGWLWGGTLAPDVAADEFGLDVNEFWDRLGEVLRTSKQIAAGVERAEKAIAQAEKEAREEAKAIAEKMKADRQGIDRETLLQSIRTLNAITSALPPEVRGQIGGHLAMAKRKTPAAMLSVIENRVEKIDTELEKWLRKDLDKQLLKLFKRAVPAKDETGKKRLGKAGAGIHMIFDTLRTAYKEQWDGDKAEAHATEREAKAASGELSAEDEATATLEASLVRMIGDWKHLGARERQIAYDAIEDTWKRGFNRWQEKKAREKEQRDEWRETMIREAGGVGSAQARKRKIAEDNGFRGKARAWMHNLFNFDQLLHYAFGEGSILADEFSDRERLASNQREDEVNAKVSAIEDLFSEMAGGAYQGEKLRAKMAEPDAITVDGETFSEFEAIDALMTWRQPDGRRHMEGQFDENGQRKSAWGWTEEKVNEVEAQLSPEAWQVLDFLTEAYGTEGDRIDTVHRDLYGIGIQRSDGPYSPISVTPQQEQQGQMTDPVTGQSFAGTATTPGWLKTRSRSAVAEPDFKDAVAKYVAHITQVEHWLAYAHLVRDLRATLNNREVGNTIKVKSGEQAVESLRKFLDYFAMGGFRDASASMGISQGLRKFTGRAASMALVGRISTLAVQVTQIGAASAKMPLGSYLVRAAKLGAGKLEMNWQEAFNSPYIRRRVDQMPVVVRHAVEGLRASKPSRLKYWVSKLGELIGGIDALWTAGTYAMIYDYQLTQARKNGLTGDDAASYARNAAERITDEVAQPTRAGARSAFELTATNPFARTLWAFSSEPRKNLALLTYSAANRSKTDVFRALFFLTLFNGALGSLIRSAWRDSRDEDDDEFFDERHWDPLRLALSIGTESLQLQGIPIAGGAIESAIYAGAGEYSPDGDLLTSPVKQGVAAARRAATDEDYDWEKAMKDAEAILTVAGLANDQVAAAASLSHLARDFFQIGKNVGGD